MKKIINLKSMFILSALLILSCSKEESDQIELSTLENIDVYNPELSYFIDGIKSNNKKQITSAYNLAFAIDEDVDAKSVKIYSSENESLVMSNPVLTDSLSENYNSGDNANARVNAAPGYNYHHQIMPFYYFGGTKAKPFWRALLPPRDNNINVGKVDMRHFTRIKFENYVLINRRILPKFIFLINHNHKNRTFEIYEHPGFKGRRHRTTMPPLKRSNAHNPANGRSIRVGGIWTPKSHRQW